MLPKTANESTFFVDTMLGNIARKLRLSGYDSEYLADIDDNKLIDSAKKENRVVVSSDEELIKKTKKLGMKSIYVTKKEEIEQFFEVISSMKLERIQINGSVARCPKCNSLTELVDKNRIKEKSLKE